MCVPVCLHAPCPPAPASATGNVQAIADACVLDGASNDLCAQGQSFAMGAVGKCGGFVVLV